MFSLLAFVTMMVAPAMARNYCPEDYTYVRYLTDDEVKKAYDNKAIKYLDSVAEAEGDLDVYAYGDDTITFVDPYLYTADGEFQFFAATVLGATGDKDGFVTVYNVYTGQVVDCDYILKKDFFRVKGRGCVYEVDEYIIEVCDTAKGEFTVDAFAQGKGAIVTDQSSAQAVGFSGTYIDIAANASEGLFTNINAKDTVKTGSNGS